MFNVADLAIRRWSTMKLWLKLVSMPRNRRCGMGPDDPVTMKNNLTLSQIAGLIGAQLDYSFAPVPLACETELC